MLTNSPVYVSANLPFYLSVILVAFSFGCGSTEPADSDGGIDPGVNERWQDTPDSHRATISRTEADPAAGLADPRVLKASSLEFQRRILSSTSVEVVLRPFPNIAYTLTAIRMPSQEDFSVEVTGSVGTRTMGSSGQLSQDALSKVVIGALSNSYLRRAGLIFFVPPLYSTVTADGVRFYLLLTSPWFAFALLKRLESELGLSIDEFLPGTVVD